MPYILSFLNLERFSKLKLDSNFISRLSQSGSSFLFLCIQHGNVLLNTCPVLVLCKV